MLTLQASRSPCSGFLVVTPSAFRTYSPTRTPNSLQRPKHGSDLNLLSFHSSITRSTMSVLSQRTLSVLIDPYPWRPFVSSIYRAVRQIGERLFSRGEDGSELISGAPI